MRNTSKSGRVRNNPVTQQVSARLPRQRTILLADTGKAKLNHFHHFIDPNEVSFLITDSCLNDENTKALNSAGLEVAHT